MCNPQVSSNMVALDYKDQAAVAEAINQLKDKDHVRGIIRIMEQSGYIGIKEIQVHTLSPALQLQLYDFLKSTGATL